MSASGGSPKERSSGDLCLRPGLRERFDREFTPSEKHFFLKKAREALDVRGYRAGDDLFFFCYFHTLRERLRSLRGSSTEGYARFLLVEGSRDLEETIRTYEERLEKDRLLQPDRMGGIFIDYLSGEHGCGRS
jgi:hypothetical protein